MVNFSFQINYLVLVFATTQIGARKILKLSNETQNELAQVRTAEELVTFLTNSSGIAEARDSYSYYYGRLEYFQFFHKGNTCILQLADGLGTYHSISCFGLCSILPSTFFVLFPDIKFSYLFYFGSQKFDNFFNR